MKMLALVTDAFGGGGGIACYNRDLLSALVACDEHAQIRVLPRFGNAVQPHERLIQHPGRRSVAAYALGAWIETRRVRPDLIFCGHIHMLPLATWLSKRTGAPVWLQVHGIDAWACTRRSIRNALSCVDLVTSVSRETRHRFLGWARIDPSLVHVLPNTVSEVFIPKDRLASRAAFGLDGRRVLLTVGRLSASERYKGHDRVMACLPNLLKQFPGLIYVIAGDGDDRAHLQQLSEALGVGEHVRFIGAVAQADLPTLYNAADLFVMPSTGEGFGIAFLEAMACGTPALGLDEDGSRDPLQDGMLGIVSSRERLGEHIALALLSNPPIDLVARVQHVFGRTAFERRVRLILDQWQHPSTDRCAA